MIIDLFVHPQRRSSTRRRALLLVLVPTTLVRCVKWCVCSVTVCIAKSHTRRSEAKDKGGEVEEGDGLLQPNELNQRMSSPSASPSILLQYVRPTWHSGVIMTSHLLFAVTIATALRRRMLLEALAMLASVVISLQYHICDENIVCPFGWSIVTWHALDVWATFFLISAVLGVLIIDPASRTVRVAMQLGFTLWVSVAVWYDRSSTIALGAILATVFASIGYRYLIQRHHLSFAVKSDQHAGARSASEGSSSSRCRPRRKVFVVRRLVIGVVIFCLALACFMVANAPISDAVRTYDPSRFAPGALKPMDVPDTAVYWFVHSIWHVASAISAFFVLRVHDYE